MAAPKGNQNARRGHHPRVQVPFSGMLLDALYTYLGKVGNQPDEIRQGVWGIVHDYLRGLDRARCFNGAKCLTGAEEQSTNEMIWCEIGQHYGWYCGACYSVDHLPKDEAKSERAAILAAMKEGKENDIRASNES